MHRIPSRQLFIYAMAWVVLSAVPSRAQEHIFEEVGVPTVPPVRFGAVAMGDYDGDGDLDVLLTGARSQDAQPITRLYRNDGIHGSSQTEVAFGNAATMEGVWQGAVTWGDYDNDGDLDLAVAGLLATGDPSTVVYTFESRDSLTVTSLALPGVWSSDLDWGDYDNDGDLDLAVCGRNGSDAPVLVIHENLLEEGLGFSVQSSELGGVMDCTLEWGDYDMDGDVDLLITGVTEPQGFVTRVLCNDEGEFSTLSQDLPGLLFSSGAWGDYDADGDLDILVSGADLSPFILEGRRMILRNDGGHFVLADDIGEGAVGSGRWGGAIGWGDFTNSGGLDFFISGAATFSGEGVVQLYTHAETHSAKAPVLQYDGSTHGGVVGADYDQDLDLDLLVWGESAVRILRNRKQEGGERPSIPVDLEVKVKGSTAMLSWSEPHSSELPGTYNLRVGTAPLGMDLVSPMADPVTGMRYISRRGNTGSGTAWTLKGLEPGRYYWSVQALNNAYTASQFSEERVFVVGSEVLAAATATVEIVPSSVVFTKLGETIRLKATAKRANGVIIEHALIVWETADAAVAEVDKQSDGSVVVTAVGSGSTEVIATAGAVSARATVRATILVVPPPPPVGPPLTEREALTALYNATGGPDWVNNTNWLSDRPLGEWYGVHTNHEGRITSLQLESNDLSGALPPEIGFFTELTWLSVVGNSQLTGPIPPEIGYLTALLAISLAANNLSGSIPREIGNLISLESLELVERGISGSIPREIGNLTNITQVVIAGGSLSGPIPSEIGNLAALRRLNLNSNRLSGPIPSEIGHLTKLTELHLSYNSLSGPVPPEIGNLTALKILNINDSGIMGPLPNELLNLQLTTFRWGRTHDDLCMPATDAFAQWAEQIAELEGAWCNQLDHDVLKAMYELAGGDGWTNQSGWPDDPVLSNRYGISTNESDQVVAIELSSNELAGQLTPELTRLVDLRVLKIGDNPGLTGRIPYTFPSLSDLQEFRYAGTGLCIPQGTFVRNWLSTVPVHEGTGADCPPSEDREVLVQLYEAWNGQHWHDSDMWLSDEPLREWSGIKTDQQDRVIRLDLSFNRLAGPIPQAIAGLSELRYLNLSANDFQRTSIPPYLGALTKLDTLDLAGVFLAGTIPPELGNLTRLKHLSLHGNHLSGSIPTELGNLVELLKLILSDNGLTGSIPAEVAWIPTLEFLSAESNNFSGPLPAALGGAANLRVLDLAHNAFSGPIPDAFGEFERLEYLSVASNKLSGPIPLALTRSSTLRELYLSNNQLSGGILPELANLTELISLAVTGNTEMSGTLPVTLVNMRKLLHLNAGSTQLCADAALNAWLDKLLSKRVSQCGAVRGPAYLTQAVQSRDLPVALVAGEEALLRVFPTAAGANSERIPDVRAEFYVNGAFDRSVDIPGKAGPIPTEVNEGSLALSVNARIPASMVRSGLEMVIEIDPEGLVDANLGVARRIPETGRLAVDVRDLPTFDLTLIPFLWESDPRESVVTVVGEMEADPKGHRLLQQTNRLLPIGDLSVTAHTPVSSSSNRALDLYNQTSVIRALEGGTGYYMGLLAGELVGASGIASLGRRYAFSVLDNVVIAHEFGHNLSLSHVPCGNPAGPDPAYPYVNGSTGVWGYDFSGGGKIIVPNEAKDLMSYCPPAWISDFSWEKALRHRLHVEGLLKQQRELPPVAALLLWGGADSLSVPFLEPAFVVDAPAQLPDSTGEYRLIGRSEAGSLLFELDFAIPRAMDGDGSSGFVFTLPVQPEWAESLASITLAGPGGTFTLDGDTSEPMAILVDEATRQVTGFLRDLAAPAGNGAVSLASAQARADPGEFVLFSNGIPAPDAWRP